MTSTLRRLLVFIGFVSLLIGMTALPSFGKDASSQKKWTAKMRELEQVLTEIMLDTSSEERFDAPKNRSRIEKSTKALASLAHDLRKSETVPPDADPSLLLLSALFSSETQRAYTELKRGHRPYARSILRTISGYCFACHTRNATGPGFPTGPFEKISASLGALEKAQLHAATRQFDKALDEFEAVVADSTTSRTRLLEWESAVRQGLAIAVRVKNDPERALRLVARVLEAPTSPYFLKQYALEWKKSIQTWSEELPRRPKTEEGLYAEAVRLISQAHSLQKYPADRGADIVYLRASSAIHELLQNYPAGKYSNEAFLLAGVSYEALRDLNIADLHEFYYEACIRRAPHTEVARTCYKHFEENMYEGFTGSGGTSLPDDVKNKLLELDGLSQPSDMKPQ